MRISSILLALTTLLATQCRQAPDTRLYLVRHAEKAQDGTDDPDLSEDGLLRAARLADMLDSADVTRLYATDWKRTRSTLAPLAARTGMEIRIYDWRDTASVAAMLKDCAGHTAVICGHSNSTPRLANFILQEEKYEPLSESEYGKLFRLTLAGSRVREATILDY